MAAIFTIGKSNDSDKAVHISEVARGLNCNCVCINCNGKLIANQPEGENARAWYFRHYVESTNCKYTNETALHQYAKELIYENNSLNTVKGIISYAEPKKERVFDTYRSDVMVQYKGKDLHFEIVVHHDLHASKMAYYRANRINSFRINLTDPSLLKGSPEEIRHAVLENKDNKDALYWDADEHVTAQHFSFQEKVVGGIVVAGVIYLLNQLVLPKKKKKRRYYQG